MKTTTDPRMPPIADLLGRARDGQPLGCVSLGSPPRANYASGWFGAEGSGTNLLQRIDGTEPADLERLARALRIQSRSLREHAGALDALDAADNLDQVATLFDRLPHIPPFRPVSWQEDGVGPQDALDFQRALWLLENDLVSGVVLGFKPRSWDSHIDNLGWQAAKSRRFMPAIARFLVELEKRSSASGVLAEQTAGLIASEIGRFPVLNDNEGKDHFPEIPCIFFGPVFQRGRMFGETGRMMEGLPISPKSGRSGQHRLLLDDVGTTLLHAFRLEPGLYGYSGEVLEFLLA
jgi:hypothetical protein